MKEIKGKVVAGIEQPILNQNVENAKQAILELREAITNDDIFGIKSIYDYSDFHIDWEAVSNSLFEEWDGLVDEANKFFFYK